MDVTEIQLTDPLTTLATVLLVAIVPFFLMVGTAFIKISVVLYILRSAIGAQQVPPSSIIFGMSILLSAFVMTPTAQKIYEQSVQPLMEAETVDRLQVVDAARDASGVMSAFFVQHAHESDVSMFVGLSAELAGDSGKALKEDSFLVLLSAFAVSQLTEAFAIGFLLFLPFLVIELVVANILLSLGMHMLSPPVVSLPFKLLLFVLVDGWVLLTRGLLLGYAQVSS